MAAHTHEDAECQVFSHEMRAAVTHKRQRGAGDRQKTDVHTHMDYELSRKIDGDTRSEERVKIVRTMARYEEYADNEDAEEAEEEYYAHESPLFGVRGENKVGLVLGKEP